MWFTSPTGLRRPPRDTDYFQTIKDIAAKETNRVYEDYVSIYDITGKSREDVLKQITLIAKTYDADDALRVIYCFNTVHGDDC